MAKGPANLFEKQARKLGRAVQNALEVQRLGKIGPDFSSPYAVMLQKRVYTLRRYAAAPGKVKVKQPLILIPALMINSDIYDIQSDASVVGYLASQGIDTWLVDFGAPEDHEGGLSRTQDDHLRAINESIDFVRKHTGEDVHLAGYSQGGMFVYQAAAWRRSEGIASLITFGAPVDIYANLPGVDRELLGRYLQFARNGVVGAIDSIDAVPGSVTSWIFRLMSADKRAVQFAGFVRDLHDRQAIERGEGKRRFLGGDGFVAWPGPALSKFADEFVVNNRLLEGGFVVDGRACSLSDITVPLLVFHGERDDIARTPCVLAVKDATPNSEVSDVSVPAGHIGLVVSHKAFEVTWPTVVQWVRWKGEVGPRPERLEESSKLAVEGTLDEVRDGLELVRGAGRGLLQRMQRSVGAATNGALALGENLRYQVSRLATLDRIEAGTQVSFGKILADRAKRNPEGAFFIYAGRGQTFAEANTRVDHVVKGLMQCGVERGNHVGVLMNNRPSYLSLVTALSRLGAVAVLLSPESRRATLAEALKLAPVDVLVADPDNVVQARESFDGTLLMLGAPRSPRPEVRDVIDMETIDTERVQVPAGYEPNPGRADDLAMIMFTAGRYDEPRAARITNLRWAVAAYGAAAAASLSARDTVYACTPLHHASGMLVAVGGAMVGGSRLAMTSNFSAQEFWPEVRRYGVTVVFYAGEMLRDLVDAPSHLGEQHNPIRLFAGSGMRPDIWRRLIERFGPVGVLEFYASTEGTGVLANVKADKIGSLGRPLPGSNDMFLASYDFGRMKAVRGDGGLFVETQPDEQGVLLTRVDETHANTTFDGYVDVAENESRLRNNVVLHGDTWFVTGDVLRRDADGDYWFCDRLSDVVHSPSGPVFTRPLEDAVYTSMRMVRVVVVYPSAAPSGEQEPHAALVLREGEKLDPDHMTKLLLRELDDQSMPRLVHVVDEIPMTDGNRPLKSGARVEAALAAASEVFVWDEGRSRYFPRGAEQPASERKN